MKAPLFFHKSYENYGFGHLHPFDPRRFSNFIELIRSDEKLQDAIEISEAYAATDEELLTVHSQRYIRHVEEAEAEGAKLSADTPTKPGITEAARHIVGGSIAASKSLDEHRIVLNTGGLHHAGRDFGEGFCVFNDVAAAAEYQKRSGRKVCILDTDAHQGNGTMDIFWTSAQVLFISIHQHPDTLYPGRGFVHEIGECGGKGYTINIPLPRDANIADYHYCFEEIIKPVISQFEPDVLIRNGGSDPHYSDTLTDLGLDMSGLEYLGRTSREIAEVNGAGYMDLMVSGYGRKVLDGWLAILKGVLELEIKTPEDIKIGDIMDDPNEHLVCDIKDLKRHLEPYWIF